MTTRQRKQTMFFIYEQPILMGKRVDGKISNYHGWNDTYDRDFDGHMWIPSENQNSKHFHKVNMAPDGGSTSNYKHHCLP